MTPASSEFTQVPCGSYEQQWQQQQVSREREGTGAQQEISRCTMVHYRLVTHTVARLSISV